MLQAYIKGYLLYYLFIVYTNSFFIYSMIVLRSFYSEVLITIFHYCFQAINIIIRQTSIITYQTIVFNSPPHLNASPLVYALYQTTLNLSHI